MATLTLRMSPQADNCVMYVQCNFEERMLETDNTYTIWREIEEEEMTLFYLTRSPITAELIDEGDSYFADLEGGDSLIPVQYSAGGRIARIPRRVVFWIQYYQKTVDSKYIIKAGMDLSEFDDKEEDS